MIAALKAASNGLAFRIAALLALALIPIGLIATTQTLRVFERADRAAEANFLALTGEAATGESDLFRSAFSASQAIAAIAPEIRDDPQMCQRALQRYLVIEGNYSFVGYIDANGIIACASSGIGTAVGPTSAFDRIRATPRPMATTNIDAAQSGEPVVVLSTPVFDTAGAFDGYVAVSLPFSRISRSFEAFQKDRPVDLITFNGEGQILSAEGGLENINARLPAGHTLKNFIGRQQSAFIGETRGGEKRIFAVVPVVPGAVYALGTWDQSKIGAQGMFNMAALPILFPILMWVASLGVAFLAVDRMVIRPTRNLRARMLVFMRSRKVPPQSDSRTTPIELREMNDTWDRLTASVLRDEAELQDTIHDRDILLREVHHRVKNNLQLIASILNLKIRKARAPEARFALGDIQGRVMSLATVHRALYETSSQGRIRVDEMLDGIVGKTIQAALTPEMQVKVTQGFDPVTMHPDQAVPLTLATSEALTNALKYIGKPDGAPAWIEVVLSTPDTETARLVIANSKGALLQGAELAEDAGSGLGEQLIKGFVQQIDGTLSVEADELRHSVIITFPLTPFAS